MEIEKISDFGVGDIVQPFYYGRAHELEGLRKVVYTHIDLCCRHPMIDLSCDKNDYVNSKYQCAGGWKPVVKHLGKRIAILVIRNEI
jgi:hypothetical protein